jgi:predicted membrane channel-forming protein YqfA (hemolysin III family)
MLFDGGYTFSNFIVHVFSIFIFILWLWLLITVFSDLFSRPDVSGFGKVLWVILLIVLPYLGTFIYLLTQGGGMAERSQARAAKNREELRNAIGFSVADELEKLGRLKASGSISDQEYARLRARLVD